MGILDSVIGNLLGGGQGQAGAPAAGGAQGAEGGLAGLASSFLGGQGQAAGGGGLAGLASSFLGGGGQAAGGGGLGGLVSQFEQAGLGDVARSWIGNGANQSVSPDQLQSVFGADQTQAMADQAGMEHGDFLQQLSQHLPAAVDGATPNGSMDV